MNYVLAPTDDDILHYKKGSESKTHKYISRVLKNGKWVYTYTKNRLKENKVTNKDGEAYSPDNKTASFTKKYGKDKLKELNARSADNSKSPGKNYTPDVLTMQTSKGYPVTFSKNAEGYYEELRNTLNKNSYAETNRDIHLENKMYTNKGQPNMQYSPQNQAINTRTRGTAYNPTGGKHTSISSRQYSPSQSTKTVTTKQRGTSYTPDTTTSKSVSSRERAPISVMGYTHVNIGGGSHAFGESMTDKTVKAGLESYTRALNKVNETKKAKEAAKRQAKEDLKNKYKNQEPDTIMGTKTYKKKQKDKLMNRTGIHNF